MSGRVQAAVRLSCCVHHPMPVETRTARYGPSRAVRRDPARAPERGSARAPVTTALDYPPDVAKEGPAKKRGCSSFSMALRSEMARLAATPAQLVEALSYEGLVSDPPTIRRWASGERNPQGVARVGQLERALQRLARNHRPPLAPLPDSALQQFWMPSGRRPTGAGSASAEASDPSDSVNNAGLTDVCEEFLARSRRRDDFVTQLPRIPVPYSGLAVQPTDNGGAHRSKVNGDDIEEASKEYIAGDTKLLVILGVFGSGKSEVLRRMASAMLPITSSIPLLVSFSDIGAVLASKDPITAVPMMLNDISPLAAQEFRHELKRNPGRIALLIDAYDEANLSAEDEKLIPSPGPTWLTRLLDAGIRVVVSARKTAAVDVESFVDLIRFAEARIEGRSRAGYRILELAPCRRDDVLDSLALLPSGKAKTMRRYFEADSRLQMESARRPLFLKMVADMDPGIRSDDEQISLYRLYDLYVTKTLERDHRSGASQISVENKRLILEHIAYAMVGNQIELRAARIATAEASKRVMQFGHHGGADADSGELGRIEKALFNDFERSNHILVPEGVGPASAKFRSFVHHTLYEFFLANHFDTSLATAGTFGVPDDSRALRAFDSLLPYFMRAVLGHHRYDDLNNMVRSDTASNNDRLLGLFFLEDTPHILDALRQSPPSYLDFLRHTEGPSDNFFMSKVARFQLILAENSIGRALWYVSDIREREVEQHIDIEVHTFGDQPNPTDFLLQRLANPLLKAAGPVFVYRLGQRGDIRALPHLQSYTEHHDPAFRAIALEAIELVQARHQPSR